MNPERWRVVERVFHEALDRPPEARSEFLDGACGTDTELREDVESLLRAHEDDPDFLETPIAEVPQPRQGGRDAPSDLRIGPFMVVRPLGQGGMGEVYLAQQQTPEFTRTVALKVIKRGMDTDEVLRRFQRERRILASLSHPNIAQLYDGGATADGRPFFAMEYVDGEPLDRYAERHALPLRDRLRLFQAVCAAVQHAHQNLIVHRDIKPGNVLVTNGGVPKLLDFGIGKVLADDPADETALTRTEARVLTPDYASPEQLRGQPVTTATDVYALGALLFKLLTGRRPFEAGDGSYETLAQAICEEAPSRPSEIVITTGPDVAADRGKLRRQLTGDLDNIILKALRKEPERRYGSAAALADDIERHLNGLPVLARPDSFGYRAGKFLRRNAWAVTTATAVGLGLIATTVVTTVQSRRVERERDKAQEVQSFLLETFGASAAEGITGDSVTVRQLLDRQSELVGTAYADEPVLQAEMLAVLADAYERLGIYDEAERLARRSLAMRRELFGEDHVDVAAVLNILGWIRHQQGESDEALSLLSESVEIWRGLGGGYREELSRALNDLGAVFDQQGNADEAEPLLREALAIRTQVLGPRHRSVGITSSNLAVLLYRRGEYAEAESLGMRALEALRSSVGPDHQRTLIAQGNVGTFRVAAGDLEGAEAMHWDLLERRERVQGRRHPLTAAAMVNYANVLGFQRRYQEAEEWVREALAIQEEVLGPSHREVGTTLRLLGTMLARQERFQDALPVLRRAVDVNVQAYGAVHFQVANAVQALAIGYARAADTTSAIREHRRAITVFDEALGSSHPRAIDARVRLGDLLLRAARPTEALAALSEAHQLASQRHTPSPSQVHGSQLRMAEAYLLLDSLAIADSLVASSERAIWDAEVSQAVRTRAARVRARIDSLRGN